MSLASLSGVGVRRAGRIVLDDVTLELRAGELVGLLGPNGAGKTTLLRVTLGLQPASGTVTLGGERLAALPPRARALAVAYVPQEHEIAWPIAVRELVRLGRLPHRRPPAEDAAAVEAALAHMDIAGLADRPATELSGGERCRALIARALAQAAPLLLLDEPTAGLDPAHSLALMAMLRALVAGGHGALVSLHDLALAARWCDRLLLLDRGRIVADGPPLEVLTPARLADVYGVTAHVSRDSGGVFVHPVALAPPTGRERKG